MDNETIEKWMAGGTVYPRDVAPHADPSVTCGSCKTFPESWSSDQWNCRRFGDCVSRDSAACEFWRKRPDPVPVDWEAMKLVSERFLRFAFTPPPEVKNDQRGKIVHPPGLRSQGNVVYFVDCGPFTKIGHTLGPIYHRLRGIETHNPFRLILWALIPGDMRLERSIHEKLTDFNHRGEWFHLNQGARDALAEYITSMSGELYLEAIGG